MLPLRAREIARLVADRAAWRAWWKALRAPSLVIAGFSCLLGIALAWRDGRLDLPAAILVLAAGLAIQAGVNLANDFFVHRPGLAKTGLSGQFAGRQPLEWFIFLSGLACFGGAALIGLYLVWLRGWRLLALGVVGLVGGYAYTGEPLNYKRRGLGVPFVFFLMGALMICGARYAVAGDLTMDTILLSLPVSCLVSLILLANELRDFETDGQRGVRTLTGRVGYRASRLLYFCLLALGYAAPWLLWLAGRFSRPWLVLLAAPLAVQPSLMLFRDQAGRRGIIPKVMLHHLAYGCAFIAALALPAAQGTAARSLLPGEASRAVRVGLASSSRPLRVGLMPALNSAPLVVADQAGLFAAEGVRVELELFTSQLNRETALQAGRIDGAISDLINVIGAWSRGFPIAVASASQGVFSLLAAPSSPLDSLSAWKSAGRRVPTGLLESSTVFYAAERALERAGVDPATIDLVPVVQVPVRMELLLAGKIEAAVLPEPLASLAVARGARRLADTAADDAAAGVIAFTRRALSERRADIAAFYRAYDRAVRELNEQPRAWRAAVVEACQFPDAARESLAFPRYRPAYLPTAADVADVATWMRSHGLVSAVPSWSDVVVPDLLLGHAGST